MKARDFEFDGKRLSDFGMILCHFGENRTSAVSDGSRISFNTVPVLGGSKYESTSSEYKECLETILQICKTPCNNNTMELSDSEYRQLKKWLSRKRFLKFKILCEGYMDIYFEAAFNINRVEIDGRLVGLELEVVTNRPFALKEPKAINIKNTVANGKHSINDTSHEEGYIYPHTEITVNESGDLKITNAIENRNTIIKNCQKGEVITMDYPVISSSISSHNIPNDFNWNFFRVANTFDNSRNDLTISIPCFIKIEYSPIVKIGI